jgi:hypothetical protein
MAGRVRGGTALDSQADVTQFRPILLYQQSIMLANVIARRVLTNVTVPVYTNGRGIITTSTTRRMSSSIPSMMKVRSFLFIRQYTDCCRLLSLREM